MPLITLTTDFGLKDHYVALLKGSLLTNVENVLVVDVTHFIQSFDIFQASFVMNEAKKKFPAGTIHLVGVNVFYQSHPEFIIVKENDQWFVGPDNGLFSLMWEELDSIKIWKIKSKNISAVESIDETFVNAVIGIANKIAIEEFADLTTDIVRSALWNPIIDQNYIRASIIYFDQFENAIVNLRKEQFENALKGRKFIIHVGNSEEFDEISESYADVQEGDKVCFFNSAGFLEIAINKGNAKGLLGLQLQDIIQIEFT